MTDRSQKCLSVAIVGGGPVGLMLANLLGRLGIATTVLEARTQPASRSMAIGITPPSLDIMAIIGLDRELIGRGVKITRAIVHESRRVVGELSLMRGIERYPFILSIPQSRTVDLLHRQASLLPSVRIVAGHRAIGIDQHDDGITIASKCETSGEISTHEASLLVACDGAYGQTAAWAGIQKSSFRYRPVFMMADFIDRTEFGSEAHLFFNPERPVESFPLPGEQRRWIVRCGWRDRDDLHEEFHSVIHRLTGIELDPADERDRSRFQPWRSLASNYGRGRIILCGDAAHVMSPIGGQGMNVGFGDALLLSRFIGEMEGKSLNKRLHFHYEKERKRAFNIAASRAAIGMHLGVATGRVSSFARGVLVKCLLRAPGFQRRTADWFTMRSLPPTLQPSGPIGS